MDHGNLQSFQISGKHPPLCVAQGAQVFWARFAENPSSKSDEVTTLVHGTDGSVAIEEKFA